MRVAMPLGGTDLGRSGIGTYIRELAPRLASLLARDGGKLVVLGTRGELEAYQDVLGETETVEIADVWSGPGLSAIWHLAIAGRAAARAHCDVLLLPAANRRIVWSSPVPVVAVVHDLAQLRVAKKYDPLRMAYLRHIVLPALRAARELVAVSSATRDDVASALDRSPEALRVVPNGVDSIRFHPAGGCDDHAAVARAALDLRGPFALYLSRLELPGKNHLRLLQAFAASSLLHTHELVLAGPDWGGLAAIEREASRLGVRDRVRLLGFVPREHVSGLVAAADVVAMVGLFEGFGLPALEALSSGVPVVASSTGGLPEVVGPLGLLCDPTNVAAMAAALDRAVTDVEHRDRVHLGGPPWARAHGWEASAGQLLGACRAAGRAA